jgi:hypothetical protein
MQGTTLNHDLIDDFQAVSVILALATVFFGIQYQKVLDVLDEPVPAGPVAREALRRRVLLTLYYRAMPIAVTSGASAYLFIPNAVLIIAEGHPDLWHFDFIRTAWLLIFALLALSFGWAFVQSYKLSQKALGLVRES